MKKILILISKATVLILLFSLSSCYYDEAIVIPKVVLDPVEDVSFDNQIQPIFDLKISGTSCADCHNGAIAPDLTAGNSYDAIINGGYIVANDLDNSVLYQTLITTDPSKIMPPPDGGVSDEDINLVESWIMQGASEN